MKLLTKYFDYIFEKDDYNPLGFWFNLHLVAFAVVLVVLIKWAAS